MCRSVLSLFLSLCLSLLLASSTSAQSFNNTLIASTLYSFESPAVGSFSYNPSISAYQPWGWSNGLGGIAAQGSPFDPPGVTTPPQNIQYAFIQTSPNAAVGMRTSTMGAVLTGLSTTATYYVSFYVGVRLGGQTGEATPNVTQSTVTLTYGSQTLWTSVNNIADSNGYMFVQTAAFTPAVASAPFNFTVVSTVDQDHSILIDAVIVNPTIAVPTATLAVGSTNTFEYPPIVGVDFDYNTPLTATQPWTWSPFLGGRATLGSPFDPPPPSTPPSGTQYAFLQTNPNNANFSSSLMTATITGLSARSSYFVSFYWAIRAYTVVGGELAGNQTQSSFSVLVNGQVVFVSPQNVSDGGGWIYAQSTAWQPVAVSNGQATVTFYVQSSTQYDHTILFDDITVSLAGAFALPTLQDFESPYVGYMYNPPVTPQQPWTWNTPSGGGIGHTGGPWDPPPPIQPPSNAQYAYLQTGGTDNATTWMQSTMFNLSSTLTYTVSFYYATRAYTVFGEQQGNQTQSQLTLYIGGQQLWQSAANISDQGGWMYVPPITFTGSGNVPIMFWVTSFGDFDHAILIDAVQFTTSQPLPTYYMYPGTLYDFENPSLAFTSPYLYNPPTSVTQPFTWPIVVTAVINGGGGVGQVGGPFDPPAPSTPPSGFQYAFMQTSPNSNAGLQLSNMSATAMLSGNQSYYITFYYGARAQGNREVEPGWQTQSTLTVVVNGNTVWSSGPNITDIKGWMYGQTSTFIGIRGADSLSFVVTSSSNDDHCILVDAITIVAGTAPPLSGSTGSNAPAFPPLVFTPGGPIVPDTVYDFESPVASTYGFIYNPAVTTSAPVQPWQFAIDPLTTSLGLGGIALFGGPFDPPQPARPPNNQQYAFVQTSPNGGFDAQQSYMTAQLTQVQANAQYTLQFYWAVRAALSESDPGPGNSTQSLFTVSYAGQTIYTSASNLGDAGGWAFVSAPFTPTATSGNLIFNVTSQSNQDHTLLFDAVIVRSPSPPLALVQPSTVYGFESPNLSLGSQLSYYYNPPQVAGSQPWTWYVQPGTFLSLGGVALSGSPFDPPAPSAPPQGSQYGFVQVIPGNLMSWMSANVSGLTSGSNYYLSFSWAIRVQTTNTDLTPGNVTSSSFVITLGSTTIYTSPANLSDAAGWLLVNSNTFSAPNGITPLTFTVTATAAADHTLLFDQVQVIPGTSPSGGMASASSSTGGGTVVLPSSSTSSVAPSSTSAPSPSSSTSSPVSPTSAPVAPSVTSSPSSTAGGGAVPSSTAALSPSSSVVPPVASTSVPIIVITPSTTSSSSSAAASASGTTGVIASSSSSGLSNGAIAGIVIGSVVGAVLICLISFLLCAGGRRGKKTGREDGSTEPSNNAARWEQQEEGETYQTGNETGHDEVEMQ